MTRITILGSTGSIGRNTLEIVEKLSHKFAVVGLAAGRNLKVLIEQVEKFKPKIVSLERKEEAEELKSRFNSGSVQVAFGPEGAKEVASLRECDVVVSAITGVKGLRPTMAAVRGGKKVALANKESMVVAGNLIQEEAFRSKARIIPVDSEHSGVFQCLAKERPENVKKVILTASGGPFFKASVKELESKTVEEALEHPRWKMGKKVTVDSATLMNKGLELIEARWLFNLEPAKLGVLIHPQSIVHSLVELRDGSVLAQLSPTDMKIPIQYALTYPQRENSIIPSLDLGSTGVLEFFNVDHEKFPLIKMAYMVLEEGGSFPIVFNAANEVAVNAFLKGTIKFLDIYYLVRKAVENHHKEEVNNLDDVFKIDKLTREYTLELMRQRL